MRNLQNLDLNLLKAFDALNDEKSVSRAAERLNLSQPAMSGILARLRESFDDPLFIRVQRGIEPTSRAIALSQPIKRLLSEVEHLLQPAIFDPLTADMTVTIACTDYAMWAVMTPFLKALKQFAPKIRVAVTAIDENRLQQQLERRLVDFAIVTADFQAPDIYALNLYAESYICAVGNRHPFANSEKLTLAQFCAAEQALVSMSGGGFSGVTDQALAKIGLKRNVSVSVQNFLILPEFLRQNQLLAVVPKRLVEGLPNIKTFAPPLEIEGFTKTLVWHARIHHDPAYRWLRELFKTVCHSE